MGLPEYRCWNRFFICSTRGINLHEDIIINDRSTWIIINIQRYIDTNNIHLWSCASTSSTFLVQIIHKDNDPQLGLKTMQYWPLYIIHSKWTRNYNSHRIRRWHTGNQRQTRVGEYNLMHQKVICDSINGWTIGHCRMYNQSWPHQDDP